MPVVIPFIAAYAATAFAVSAGIVVAGSLAAMAIGAAASLAASYVMGQATKPKGGDAGAALTGPGAGRLSQFRQPITAHSIPYGHIKTSGPIVFVHSQEDRFARTYGDLYLIHVLAATKIKAIRTIYLDDELETLAKFDEGGGLSRITKYLGSTTQAADPNFLSEISFWTANHRLQGRAYTATRFTWDSAILPSTPNLSAIIDGVDTIYDPRDASTAFKNNAALCIADWLTKSYGMNLPWTKVDEVSVAAAANICDERVPVAAASTTYTIDATTELLTLAAGARSLDWGDGVRLSTSGTMPTGLVINTTYYVIPGPDEKISLATTFANALAGTAINLNDGGVGTQTLTYWDEARYKCNGSFTLDVAKRDTLEQLLTSMAGVVVHLGGKWYLYAGAAATPTLTLTDDDLRGDLQVAPRRSMRDRINGARAVFVNPDAKWQPTDARPRLSATYLAEDDGEELYDDLRFPFTTSARTVQRLMKIHVERNRRQQTVSFPAKLTAMKLAPWDGVYLNISRLGWTAEQHRVLGWALSDDGGINLQLQEDDSAIYSWTSAEETSESIGPVAVTPHPQSTAATPPMIQVTPEATGDAVTDDYTAILAAQSRAVTAGSALFFPRGTYNISASITFTVPVVMEYGATFISTGSPTSNKTVLFNGGFEASISPHFGINIIRGVGTNGPGEVFPQWWGATGNGTTDDSASIQAAIDYCELSGDALRMLRTSGWYYCGTTGLVINGSIKFHGDGASTIYWSDAYTGTCITVSQPNCILADFSIAKTKRATPPNANTVGIYFATSDGTMRNVRVTSYGSGAYYGINYGVRFDQWSHIAIGCSVVGDSVGVYGAFANAILLSQCFISARDTTTAGAAVYFFGGGGNSVKGCDIEGSAKRGVYVIDGGTADSGTGTLDISGCYFEGHEIEIEILGTVTSSPAAGKDVMGVSIMGNLLSGMAIGLYGIKADFVDGLVIGGNCIINQTTNAISLGANVHSATILANAYSSTVVGWVDLSIHGDAQYSMFHDGFLVLENSGSTGNGIRNARNDGYLLMQGGDARLKGAGLLLLGQTHASSPREGRLFASPDGSGISYPLKWGRSAGAAGLLGFYDTTPVAQPSTTGTIVGFTSNASGSPTPTTVNHASTFTGGVGTKAYTVGDLVKALKDTGFIASS